MIGVPLVGRDWGSDPRLSKPQIEALLRVVAVDADAYIVGLDHAHRPVVSACVGVPPTLRTWAIQRNGDPCSPRYSGDPFDLHHAASRMLEVWGRP